LPSSGRGLSPLGAVPLNIDINRASQKTAQEIANQTAANDREFGRGYNGDFVDRYDPTNLQFGQDARAFERMGYNNYGDVWQDAFNNLKDAGQNALRNIGNWFNPNRYRPPKVGNPTSNPGTPMGKAGVLYHVTGSYQNKQGQTIPAIDATVLAPFSITERAGQGDVKLFFLKDANGERGFLDIGKDNIQGSPKIDNATRLDGIQDLEPNRTSEPGTIPAYDPSSAPSLAPLTQAPPTTAPQPLSPGTPTPYPFPDYPGLPRRMGDPTPTQNPATSPANSPAPAPTSTPGQQPSSPGGSLQAPSLNPVTPTTLDPVTKQFPNPSPQPNTLKPPTPPNCKDPCVQKLNDKQDEQKPVTIKVKVFKACKTDDSGAGTGSAASAASSSSSAASSSSSSGSTGSTPSTDTSLPGNAIYEEKSIQVPKAEADSYKLLYARLARLEAAQCNKPTDAIASVPEWWQLRAEAQRPQFVVIFAEVLGTGKLTDSRWSLTIPHYNRPKGFKPRIPDYNKGNFEGILTLTDNSKIIVNASSEMECKRVINALKILVDAKYRTQNGKAIKAKVGERLNSDFKKCKVTPTRGDFYSTGARNMQPTFSVNFRAKK
jgi:hypothetical protein